MSATEEPPISSTLENGKPQLARESKNNTSDEADMPPTTEFTARSILTLVGVFSIFFVTIGYINTFGVFEQYYTSHFLSKQNPSAISWLGSFNVFCLYAASLPAGILSDRYGPRPLIIFGSITTIVAMFLTSLCTVFYQFFLAQGFLLGVGIGCLFCPTIAMITLTFRRARGLALGIVVSGSSLGGVIWPIMLRNLLQHVGFAWTVRIAGFVMLGLLGFACLTVRRPPVQAQAKAPSYEKEQRPELDLFSIVKTKTLMILSGGLFFVYLGLFTPFFYVASYTISLGLNPDMGFYMISILNAASLFGRLIPGYFADRWGPYNMFILASSSSALVILCWTSATTIPGIIVWSAAYGFCSGAIISLQGACAAKSVKPGQYGVAIGVVLGILSIAALIGPPISGQLLDKSGYLAVSLFSGFTLLIGAFGTAAARYQLNSHLLAKV